MSLVGGGYEAESTGMVVVEPDGDEGEKMQNLMEDEGEGGLDEDLDFDFDSFDEEYNCVQIVACGSWPSKKSSMES